ncbi:hypothetical protein C1I98_06145 [Spongiactinospora gelatinilytica]|uniref:Uncharacterized protein n=1 Tax=Spongiactinospora gelatinilytica TaxID=2666298 RepID=A0A2W2HND8_9ACTN|nr:hypothetical protein [Spongiactinospora gelatinilytica]PZG53135.1 hypothetical protein C1I98_06145 [Spongiactinospora gelatinilytica]
MGVRLAPTDSGRGTTLWQVERWDADAVGWVRRKSGLVSPGGHVFRKLGVASYQTTEHLGNAILSAGWTRILNLLIGTGSTQAMDATHTRIGVGDGTTAVTTADTTLTGSTNKYFKTAAGVGTIGAGAGPPTTTLTISATFGTGVANFAWQKFGVDFGTTDGATEVAPLLNAAVSNQGTKASGQVWTATATLSWT